MGSFTNRDPFDDPSLYRFPKPETGYPCLPILGEGNQTSWNRKAVFPGGVHRKYVPTASRRSVVYPKQTCLETAKFDSAADCSLHPFGREFFPIKFKEHLPSLGFSGRCPSEEALPDLKSFWGQWVDSPFFSTILRFKNQSFSLGFLTFS